MNIDDRMYEYEKRIRSYEEEVNRITEEINSLYRKVDKKADDRNLAKKEMEKIDYIFSQKRKKANNLSIAFPQTKFVAQIAKSLLDNSYHGENKIIRDMERCLRVMNKTIQDDNEKIESFKKEREYLYGLIEHCREELVVLRRMKNE